MSDVVDRVLAAIDPGLAPLSIVRRDVVVVAGPWLAGTTSVVGALRNRLSPYTVLEADELTADEAPAAVVFVVSATAPLTESDCALLDWVTADTDAVIGVVSKIDVHRTWRAVLDADRALLAQRDARYRDMAWVGAAAAPDLGAPVIDDLVSTLTTALADDTLERRNRLRALENRLLAVQERLDRDVAAAAGADRLAALRDQRAGELRRFRLERSGWNIAVRSQIQQARAQLSYLVRTRCAALRTELQEEVASLPRRRFGGFHDQVRRRAAEVSTDLQEATARRLTDVGEQLGVAVESAAGSRPLFESPTAPMRSRGAEAWLMMLLGVGFGLGVAFTVSRVFAHLARQWTVGGAISGAIVGLAVTLWVVGVRGLLRDRAALARWVAEVAAGLRTELEEWVTTRVLAAETSVGRAAAERDAEGSADTDRVVARIDAEIRELGVQRARAAAVRDRHVPLIESALAAVRTEFAVLHR